MRVCFLSTSYPRRQGDFVGNFIEGIAIELVKLGHEVFVITPRYGAAKPVEHIGRLHIFRFTFSRQAEPSSLYDLKGAGWVKLGFLLIQMFRSSVALGKKYKVHVVHAHWVVPSGLAGLLAARLLRRPLIVSSYGSDLRLAPQKSLMRAVIAFVLKRSNHFIGVSNDLLLRALALGLEPTRGSTIPDGVRADLFAHQTRNQSAPRRRWNLGSSVIMLYVGRLHRLKGLETLIEAMGILSTIHPNLRLVLAGDGPEMAHLSQLVTEGDISRSVTFLGAIPHAEIPKLISLANVCVSPSLSEGLPSFLQEAMLAGKPIVATDVGGNPDIVANGSTGLLVKPSDPNALARAISRILENRTYAKRLGQNAKQFAEANLTTEITARKVAQIYDDAAKNLSLSPNNSP